MRGLAKILVAGFCLAFAHVAGAQAQGGESSVLSAQGANADYEFGLHIGNLLPNQIAGVTEIMGLAGVRAGFRLAPLNYTEFGLITGNGEGQQWKNVTADIRTDIPVENLMGIAFVGLDANYFKGIGDSTRLIFGGHLGGGLMAHLGGSTWVRADMKFSFSPGTSLYIGIGLIWRLGGGAGGN